MKKKKLSRQKKVVDRINELNRLLTTLRSDYNVMAKKPLSAWGHSKVKKFLELKGLSQQIDVMETELAGLKRG